MLQSLASGGRQCGGDVAGQATAEGGSGRRCSAAVLRRVPGAGGGGPVRAVGGGPARWGGGRRPPPGAVDRCRGLAARVRCGPSEEGRRRGPARQGGGGGSGVGRCGRVREIG